MIKFTNNNQVNTSAANFSKYKIYLFESLLIGNC